MNRGKPIFVAVLIGIAFCVLFIAIKIDGNAKKSATGTQGISISEEGHFPEQVKNISYYTEDFGSNSESVASAADFLF